MKFLKNLFFRLDKKIKIYENINRDKSKDKNKIKKRGRNMKEKILKFWKEEKTLLILVCFILFLAFNLARATNTITELRLENQDLLESLDRYIPNEEENY